MKIIKDIVVKIYTLIINKKLYNIIIESNLINNLKINA